MSEDGLTAMQRLRERLKEEGLVQYNITPALPVSLRDFARAKKMQPELKELIHKYIEERYSESKNNSSN